MKHRIILSVMALSLASCTTMNESLELGGGLGAVGGAAAMYTAIASTGRTAAFGDVAAGAGVGMAVGLLSSYFTHIAVENRRQENQVEQTEMTFGDLPPSPFIVPKVVTKKGAR